MLKIFTTQLTGKFKHIIAINEEMFENCALALAQAYVSKGTIYIHGLGDMASVALLATCDPELLPRVEPLFQEGEIATLDHCDRVLLFVPSVSDEETLSLIRTIESTRAVSIIISASKQPEETILDDHFTLFLQATDALVPLNETKKIGIPANLCAVFAYECLCLLTTEILTEYEEDGE